MKRDIEVKMNKTRKLLSIILMSVIAVSVYAGIIYNGQEYTETDMPFSKDGGSESYFVFSGTINSVNSWNMRNLTINGVEYANGWSSSMPAPVDGKKYFVYYNPKNKFAHFEIDGTNDWSGGGGDTTVVVDTVSISLPFEKDGIDRVYLSTAGTITSLSSWSMDTVSINGVDYTNIWSSTLPERIDGKYYIYYSSSSAFSHLEIAGDNTVPPIMPDSLEISLPYSYDGVEDVYFIVSETIGSINSWGADSVIVNGVDFTNVWSSSLPQPIDGKYYIHYKATQSGGHFEIAAVEDNPYPEYVMYEGNSYKKVFMPYTISGSTETYVYVYGTVQSFSSSNMNLLEINGIDYTNQSLTTAPPSIGGKYFIKYIPKNKHSNFQINGTAVEPVYVLNIKLFLQGALN